jgi:adenine-specific DNA-methyltransferase
VEINVKEIINQISLIAERFTTVIQQKTNSTKLLDWICLHGWDTSDTKTYSIIAKQALLNAVIRQCFPNLTLFKTPFDFVTASDGLVGNVQKSGQESKSFNFWGDLYSKLIPQPYRRRSGQFWTDEHIAEWMVTWLLQFQPMSLNDVGCGAGNFLIKAAQQLGQNGQRTELYGFDMSPVLLNVARATFSSKLLATPKLDMRDYLHSSIPPDAKAVICNPPYTRHHHIPPNVKDLLQIYLKRKFNLTTSRKATMAFYFLLKIISEMTDGAHAAVIVPMEVLDAVYGKIGKYVLRHYTVLSAIVHFSKDMNAFHKVDVGASILLFRKGYEKNNLIRHVMLRNLPTTNELLECLDASDSREFDFGSVVIKPQNELEKISKWFSITSPATDVKKWEQTGFVVPLKSLAKVMRGIATGANEFFALSTQEVAQKKLSPYVVPTIQRNREIQDILLDEQAWESLSNERKRVWLLYLNGKNVKRDEAISAYLGEGESRGYHHRSLVQTRKKWFFMEQRDIPPIFFTILTRGNPRFILNKAGVRPLNMFSLIYPNIHIVNKNCTEILWALLNSKFTISRLHSVSRTYGGNTLKVEPRELDNLPVINPLAMTDGTQSKMRELIDKYYHHRNGTMFLKEIDALVDKLLYSGPVVQYPLSVPVQLQLMEKIQRRYE